MLETSYRVSTRISWLSATSPVCADSKDVSTPPPRAALDRRKRLAGSSWLTLAYRSTAGAGATSATDLSVGGRQYGSSTPVAGLKVRFSG